MRHPWVSVAIKAAVTLSLIVWLLHRIDLVPVIERVGGIDPAIALAAIVLMMAQLLLTGWRWAMIARIIGAPMMRDATLRLTLIGQFFNQTLPSAIGGDAVRAWLLSREGVSLTKAVSGVFADRVVALVLLVAIVGAMLPALYARVPAPELRASVTLLVVATAAGVIILLACGPSLARLLRRHRLTQALAQLADDLRFVLISPGAAAVVASAVVVHLGVVTSAWLVARALAIDVTLIDCLVLVPPVVLLTTLPISIAGWGVRESATVIAFGFVGVPPVDAVALSVVFGLVQIVIGLPGGALWIARPSSPVAASADQKSTHRPPRSQSP
ncbi:MAG TPA: lysylphosphatidylglycerol synthase transmembrane domain-containing protein [Alphaproteobacteria bacterium]|nr:lysylphosphatidylglycerol synthase transmembrane domain-containing protein [Alphaproteobacteria bacterium]